MSTAFPLAVTSDSVIVSPLTAVTVKSGARCPTLCPTGMFGVAVGTGVAVGRGRGVAVGAGRGVGVAAGAGMAVGGGGAVVGTGIAVGGGATGGAAAPTVGVGSGCAGSCLGAAVGCAAAAVGVGAATPLFAAPSDGSSGAVDALGPASVSSHSRHFASFCSPPFLRRTISPEASMPIAADCCVMR